MTTSKESTLAHPELHTLTGVIRFDAFDHLYTELRVALQELKKRRRIPALKKVTREELGPAAKDLLKEFSEPRAIFFRQVATPTHETLHFLQAAKKMNLRPLILEYHDDKFVSAENRTKRLLGKMPLYQYKGSDGRHMVKYETVCDFNTVIGKKFREVQCLNGEKLIPFHHRLFKKITGRNPAAYSIDASEWFKSNGGVAHDYYEKILTLLIRDGILFENFMPFRSETVFTKNIVSPAFEKLGNAYGVKPLIVRLLPEDEELRLYWDSYPREIAKHLSASK